MEAVPATDYGRSEPFAPTQWSVILAAGRSQTDPESSRVALAQLCETYWPPLYAYVRSRGHSIHDAQDLTQSFFAYLLEHKIYRRTDRANGKFRSFLLASLKNFLSDAWDRERTLKRGGGRDFFIPLDEGKVESAESLFNTHHSTAHGAVPHESLFDRSWADTLVATVLDRLATAYRAEGKQGIFSELQTFLNIGSGPLPSYAELAVRLGIAESTLRSHVTRLRARYREILRAEVRRTVHSETEVNGELRELLRVLTAG